MFKMKGPSMIKNNYSPAFPLKHQQKDMRLALALGDENAVSMPVAAAANEVGHSSNDLVILTVCMHWSFLLYRFTWGRPFGFLLLILNLFLVLACYLLLGIQEGQELGLGWPRLFSCVRDCQARPALNLITRICNADEDHLDWNKDITLQAFSVTFSCVKTASSYCGSPGCTLEVAS